MSSAWARGHALTGLDPLGQENVGNSVLKVDPESAYALLAPGVSYFDFHACLVRHNLRDQVWGDVPDVGGSSVIGNMLERGAGYTPYGDHCGQEQAAHEQEPNESRQLFDYGLGPQSGILSESPLGIIVRMGIWLMPNPGGYQAYMITFPRDNDLDQIFAALQPPHQIHNYTDSNKLLTDLNKIAGAKFYFPEDRPNDIALQTRSDTMQRTPFTTELGLLSWLPNSGHLFFSPITKITGPDAKAQDDITRRLIEEYGFDFIGKDPDSRRRAYELIQVLTAEAADRGWGEYRAHLVLIDQIAEIYSFNGNAQMK
ncbi:hypothetical protein BDV27DRAFT_165209 [Aspergillus caelatus]|uniref:Uncharacterized protein n=1 Tax=Aspergillus caelatus TaxID=61420 RepID=A0A5N7A2D5_9EURO|nr:uncharacterized protein BDV27DRAFT_165209 [Aspergillus caelatus]KAE8363855.1 hypothetical protein BDV27DRAFT_165209 [Aspergillus caelatus]